MQISWLPRGTECREGGRLAHGKSPFVLPLMPELHGTFLEHHGCRPSRHFLWLTLGLQDVLFSLIQGWVKLHSPGAGDSGENTACGAILPQFTPQAHPYDSAVLNGPVLETRSCHL